MGVPDEHLEQFTETNMEFRETNMDTLGIEPRASRMLSGCDTTTPRAPERVVNSGNSSEGNMFARQMCGVVVEVDTSTQQHVAHVMVDVR